MLGICRKTVGKSSQALPTTTRWSSKAERAATPYSQFKVNCTIASFIVNTGQRQCVLITFGNTRGMVVDGHESLNW